MTNLSLLEDRPMTPAEIRGFRLACAGFAHWGHQLRHESISLGGPARHAPTALEMQRLGEKMIFMAEALDLTVCPA